MGVLNIKEKRPVRKYTGKKWKTNSYNKKELEKDFHQKCAYCDDHHFYSGGYNSFHVEHFAPKDKFKEFEFVYDNLLYSCPYCNCSKSNKWVGKTIDENIVGDQGFIDPCTDDYDKHLARNDNGEIIPLTKIGEYMYKELKFYLMRHKIIYNLERMENIRLVLEKKLKKRDLKKKIIKN